jgi:hypothetical protein
MSSSDYIINPKTQRPIKIGSRVWRGLVSSGVIEGVYNDPKELYELQEEDDIDQKISSANEDLPPDKQAVRGRGKYKGKIVSRNYARPADFRNEVESILDQLIMSEY